MNIARIKNSGRDDYKFHRRAFRPWGDYEGIDNGAIPLEIIEVQSGSYLGEDDIVRFQDVYDRC